MLFRIPSPGRGGGDIFQKFIDDLPCGPEDNKNGGRWEPADYPSKSDKSYCHNEYYSRKQIFDAEIQL